MHAIILRIIFLPANSSSTMGDQESDNLWLNSSFPRIRSTSLHKQPLSPCSASGTGLYFHERLGRVEDRLKAEKINGDSIDGTPRN